MTDFTQDLFARRRNASDGNTRVVSAGKLWYDSVTNSIRVSDGHTPGGQIVTGQSGAYVLPTATSSVKGGVQLGANIIATGASIDVLQPTRVSQLENDSNYLTGLVLAGYATETFVTTQGYITSAALSSGNANVIAANSRIASIDANIGAYQIWANANVSTLTSNAASQATSINSINANVGSYQTWANGRITTLDANLGTATTNITTLDANLGVRFTTLNTLHANVGAYETWANGRITTLDANIGTLSLGNISTQSNLGAYQTWANGRITTLDANLGTATTNISNLVTQANANVAAYLTTYTGNLSAGNINVGAGLNYYNSAGAGKGLDIVSTFASKVGYLNLVGGSGSSGLLTFGNTAGIQAVVTTGTDNSLTFATKNPSTGANVASAALTLYSDQTARLSGNLTVGQSNGNILITNGYISGTYTPTTAIGAAVQLTGKDTQGGTGWFDFLKVTNITSGASNGSKSLRLNSTGFIEIINSAYTATIFSLSDAGTLSVSGDIQVSGKKAVNGPAFSAYANNTLQTITSGSQQKVLFQVEEFDTDGCFANSRFTPTVEGYYQLNAEVRLDGSSSTGEIMIVLYKNTSEYKRGTNQSGSSIATNFWAMQVSTLVYANGTTDYFEIKVQQTSGGNVSVTAVNNPAITWFNGAMVRGA
jgi:hypothetical protein